MGISPISLRKGRGIGEIPAISNRLQRSAGDEAGAGFAVFAGWGIDAAQDALGEGDVKTLGFPRQGGKIHGGDRPDHAGIVGIGGVAFDGLWKLDFFPRVEESLDVEGNCLRGVGIWQTLNRTTHQTRRRRRTGARGGQRWLSHILGFHRKCVIFRKTRSDSRTRPCCPERVTSR